MSPWTLLAWIVLAALYVAACVGAWLIGAFLGWPDWPVPAAGTGIVALALLFALVKKHSAPSETPPPVAPGMQVLTPAMAALVPPRELARRWTDFLPLLGKAERPLFLVLGEDDALRRRLWLSTPECRHLRDEASGLAFAVYPGSLWVDVPAALVAPPAAGAGLPVVSAGAPGLWEELVRFLPRLPGELRGVLALVDSVQDGEAAARNGQWLAGKLDVLYAKYRKTPPVLWIASTRLERFPGGGGMVEKIAASGDGGRALLGSALGAVPRPSRSKVGAAAFASCLEGLDKHLDAFLLACDSTGQDGDLSPEAHLVRHSLSAMTRNAQTVCEALAKSGRAKAAVLGGLFLCGGGDNPGGLAFGAAIPRNAIPDRSRRLARGKPNRVLYTSACFSLIALAAGLGFLYGRAKDCIDATPFHLLEASPNPGGFGGPPPVARYARARRTLDALERSYWLTRKVYRAPGRGLDAAEKRLAGNLPGWLPASDEPALVQAWLDGLAEWVEGQGNVKPAVFATPAGRPVARIRGAHGKAGRATAAKLLSEWSGLLGSASRAKIDFLQAQYDLRLCADWRRNGKALLAAAAEAADADDFAVTRDFLAGDPGFAFAAKAGEEMAFGGKAETEWALAAAAAARANRTALALDADEMGFTRIREAAKTAKDAWDSGEPVATFEKNADVARRLKGYRGALAALHPRSQEETALADLAAEAYAPPGGNPPPPSLVDVDSAWTALAGALRTLEPAFAGKEGREVLALVKSRYTLLSRAAMAKAAARVQDDWERTVLAPPDGNDTVVFLLDRKPHEAFVKGFAGHFLVSRDQRRHPASALGREFPFREEAVAWLNQTETLIARLDREYPVRLVLLPVNVGKSARIFPRGIRFAQNTAKGPITAVGYNNKVEIPFTWSVRTCLDVELSVLFDAFAVKKKYAGAMGLVQFLQSLNQGKLVLPSSAFPERRNELERCGVDSITVNFEVTDGEGVAELNAKPRKPPLQAVNAAKETFGNAASGAGDGGSSGRAGTCAIGATPLGP